MKPSTPQDIEALHAEIEQLRQRVTELEAERELTVDEHVYYDYIHETAISLMQRQDLDGLLDAIVQRACQIAGTEHGFLVLQDADKQFRFQAPRGMFANELAANRPSSPTGTTRIVLDTGQLHVIYDYDNHPDRFTGLEPGYIYAIATLPLFAADQVIGTMSLVYQESNRLFTDKILQRLGAFADMASIAVTKARLYENLRQSQLFIKGIAETVPDILHIYDYVQDRSIYANHPIGKLLGYSPAQIQAMGHQILTQIVHPDDRVTFETALQQLQKVDDNTTLTHEYRLRHADGSYRWFRSRVTPFNRDRDGSVAQSIGISSEITGEKQMINDLRQSEERFRVIFHGAPVGIVLTNRGAIKAANPAFCKMIGYTEAELLEKHFSHITPPEHSVREFVLVDSVLKGETDSYTIQKEMLCKDGSRVWVRVSSALLHGLDNVTGIGIIEDITERVAAETAVRESEARFRGIFESAAVGIAVTDAKGYISEANKTFCEMFGYEIKEIFERPYMEYTHPDDYERELAAVRQMLDHEMEQYSIEKRVKHRDGHYMWVRLTGSLINLRGQVRGIGIIEDITARKAAEEQLRASEQRFRSLLDVIPIMIVIYQNDQITYVNPTGLMLSGFPHDPTDSAQTLPPDAVNSLRQLKPGNPEQILGQHHEIEISTPQGEKRWLDLTFLETTLDGQEAIIGIGLDVTERKAADGRSVKLAVERERLRVLADFIRDAGHDFRTPLAVINTSLHLLERSDDEERKVNRLKVIRDQVDHLDRLVDGLLVMVRHDSELPMSMHILNINTLLKDGMSRLHEIAGENEQTLEFDLTPDRLTTLGNALELHRAVTSVIDNALRYSPGQTTILVETAREASEAIIRVIDHGTGIKPEDQERIFERFYRADEGRAAGGLGLGLSLARRIVERHHGRVEVQSVYGEGSTFSIHLPLIGVPL